MGKVERSDDQGHLQNQMSALLKPTTITVTKEFVAHADSMWERRGQGGKRIFKSREKCDALLYEHHLLTHKYVSPPTHLAHDFIWNGWKVDVKEVNGANFNIQKGKLQRYIDYVNKGQLALFLFYETDRDINVLLKEGDAVNVQPLYVLPAKTVLKSTNESIKSKTHDAFIDKSTLKMLSEPDNE